MSAVREFCTSLAADSAPLASGVYVILNIATRRFYIGKSVNIAGRIGEHKSLLRMAKHSNSALQADWNEHGPTAFIFAPFALADAAEIDRLERDLIAESVGQDCYNWLVAPMSDRGQGRKPLKEGVESVIVPIRMLPEHRDTFKLLGGAEWLRKLLDKEAKKLRAKAPLASQDQQKENE